MSTSAKSGKSTSDRRPSTPLINTLYEHMKQNTGYQFGVEELAKEMKVPASSIRRSLTRSVKRPDMYPGLFAYVDGTYAFTERVEKNDRKATVTGNTQTETFTTDVMEAPMEWKPGAMLEVMGRLPSGDVLVIHESDLFLVEITLIGSIKK